MASTKAELRQLLSTARRNVTERARAEEANALTRHIAGLITPPTVCAYVPTGTEPGSPAMLDALRAAGARVLLPITLTTDDGLALPLAWGEYRPGTLVSGRYGLQEPGGPRLPADALARAGLVLVPALAVDRRGARLGRGGGFYDRSLPLCAPTARLVAVVRDDELLEEVPSEPHDIRMTHALTPGRGVVRLGGPG